MSLIRNMYSEIMLLKLLTRLLGTIAWCRHQMETFSALLAICAGNSPVTGEFPAQRPEARSFDVFIDLRPNKRLSKQSWGWWFETPLRPLNRHSNGLTCRCETSGGLTDATYLSHGFGSLLSSSSSFIVQNSKITKGIQASTKYISKITAVLNNFNSLRNINSLWLPQGLLTRRSWAVNVRIWITICTENTLKNQVKWVPFNNTLWKTMFINLNCRTHCRL